MNTSRAAAIAERFCGLEIADQPLSSLRGGEAEPTPREPRGDRGRALRGNLILAAGSRTLQELADAITKIKASQDDLIIARKDLQIGDHDGKVTVQGGVLTRHGLKSLSDRLRVPEGTIAWLESNEMALLPEILRRAHARAIERAEPHQKYLVRQRISSEGDLVTRFVGTEQYLKIDNDRIVEAAMRACEKLPKEFGEPLVVRGRLPDCGDGLNAAIVFPALDREMPGDSTYSVGASLLNREDGGGSSRGLPFIFRRACLNGSIFGREMIPQAKTVRIHKGGQVDDTDAVAAELEFGIRLALEHTEWALDLVAHSKELAITDIKRTIVANAKRHGLSSVQAVAWFDAWKSCYPEESAWHLTQALTQAAQDFDDATRVKMESASTAILAPSLGADLREIISRWDWSERSAEGVTENEIKNYLKVAL